MTMRRSASALAGLLVTLAGASRPAAAAPADGAVWARAFDHGEYPRAIDLARRRLQAVPADTAARLVMSRAEAALGHFEAAYQGFRRVLSTDPRNTDALYYLTILGGVLAQAEYDRLFALAPDSPRAGQLLGDLAVAQERPADAEAQYKAALQSAPDSLDLLLALGDLPRHQHSRVLPRHPLSRCRVGVADRGQLGVRQAGHEAHVVPPPRAGPDDADPEPAHR